MATAVTVSQLNTYVKSLLESDVNLNPIFVCGEISNFTNHYRTGHMYMTIKDDKAQIKAVMFRSSASRLQFMPQDGMSVIILGHISLYERDGQYQLYIDQMQPDGVGSLSVAYEQLKAQLSAEGLFDEENKKPIPRYPRRIVVITSKTGAAVRDIINILGRRYPLAEVMLCGVQVQGERAPAQLVSALKLVNEGSGADVIIIGRGGGSIEDLWAFNDENVVRAVAASKIPVISAVGHETDYTLCDFAADLRAPTPSAAAELAVPDILELMGTIEYNRSIIEKAAKSMLASCEMRFDRAFSSGCFLRPEYYADRLQERVKKAADRLRFAAVSNVRHKELQIKETLSVLDALNPMKIMARGFAAVSADKGRVRLASELKVGDKIELTFSDGSVGCTVSGEENTCQKI